MTFLNEFFVDENTNVIQVMVIVQNTRELPDIVVLLINSIHVLHNMFIRLSLHDLPCMTCAQLPTPSSYSSQHYVCYNTTYKVAPLHLLITTHD